MAKAETELFPVSTRDRSVGPLGLGLASSRVVLLVATACLGVRVQPARAAVAWVNLGPSGGPVTAVAADPQSGNQLYAGTVGAGVFHSTDGGRTWRPSRLPGSVTRLAVAPGTRTVYAITAVDFFASSDLGETWVSLAGGLSAAGAGPAPLAVALPAAAPGTVYALVPPAAGSVVGTGSGGAAIVVKSTDGGGAWSRTAPLPAGVLPSKLLADASDPATVFLVTDHGVFASRDGGSSWTAGSQPGGNLDLAVESGPRHRLLAISGVASLRPPTQDIYVSADRGRTWRLRNGLGGRPLQALLGDPTTPGAFIAVDLYTAGVWRTQDGGLSWKRQGTLPGSGMLLDLSLDSLRPGVAHAALLDGGPLGRSLYTTADFGATWTLAVHGLAAGGFGSLLITPGVGTKLFAGTTQLAVNDHGVTSPQGIWQSSDRGETWRLNGPGSSGIGGFAEARQGETVFAATLGDGLQRTDDQGGRWRRVALRPDFVLAVASPAEEQATLYALADDVQVALEVSLDGGATWTARPHFANRLAVAPGSPATLYTNANANPIAFNGQESLQRSTDRGVTWTTLFNTTGMIHAIALDPADPRRLAAGVEGLDSSGKHVGLVFSSRDGGATWIADSVSPDRPAVLSLLFDPFVPQSLLAGTSAGVYASVDGGRSWQPLGDGLQTVPVLGLATSPNFPNLLYAATAGAGIFQLVRTTP